MPADKNEAHSEGPKRHVLYVEEAGPSASSCLQGVALWVARLLDEVPQGDCKAAQRAFPRQGREGVPSRPVASGNQYHWTDLVDDKLEGGEELHVVVLT